MWLKSFKIAIAERNTDRINSLSLNIPEFDSIEEMNEALYLIKEASKLIETLQHETLEIKNKLKKNIEFIQSNQIHTTSKFDTNN